MSVFRTVLSSLSLFCFLGASALAEDIQGRLTIPATEVATVAVRDRSTDPVKSSTVRLRVFQESMLPALGSGSRFVPKSSGDLLIPMFTLSQFGIDEEVMPSWRLFYLQKIRVLWGTIGENTILTQFFDPRFGIRKTKLFGESAWQSELDFFIHPGFNRTILVQSQRLLDLGLRMTNRYPVPGTAWVVGGNFELVSTLYRAGSRDADWSGVLSLMASYRISSLVSTQSWIYGFYKHKKGESLTQFYWDITDLPFLQNGLSLSVSQNFTVSWMLNQYLGVTPSLNNMWMSLWLSMNLG